MQANQNPFDEMINVIRRKILFGKIWNMCLDNIFVILIL